ncbi:MAG: squalene--hopene cyclase [Verrucomicrobia bacterium]|nr:squalene--hopene cyclase [Verrucomicrobiota bacterium]
MSRAVPAAKCFTPSPRSRTFRRVSVFTTPSRSSAEPRASAGSAHESQPRVDAAIRRAQDHLFRIQKPEGYWVGELMVDSTLVSDMLAFYHWWGRVDAEWQRKAVNHIFSKQLPDGGWNIYLNGPAEVNATVKAYLALKLAGVPVTDPRMLAAREMAMHLGGVPRMNTFSKLYLALIGLVEWHHVPVIPCEVILLGKWFHVNFHDMSNWTRSMLVPLAIINHFRPTRRVKVDLDELYPGGKWELEEAIRPRYFDFGWRNFFLWLNRLHQLAEWVNRRGLHPFRATALRRAERWMIERFEGSDGLAAIFPAMLNSLIALLALGYPDDHPEVVRAHAELVKLMHEEQESVRIEPCFSPVWDTAIVNICLRESGVPADDARLVKSAGWLMDREIRFKGDWQHKNPTDIEPSGWVFEYNNKWNPDVDDTAMVLLALRLVPTADRRRRDECFRRGYNWMLAFQCKDGGWAAFDRDCTRSVLEKVPFADHNAMLDPECVDITARILEVMGLEGAGLDNAQVQRALRFIREAQERDGSFYGRWGVNYIYGTWQVLRGLRAMNHNMREPWLLKARDWLRSVQRADGGWGERCNTYDDPIFKAAGPSTASQTAWAVMGLAAFDDPGDAWMLRGVDYLVRAQNPDGSWTEDETTGTGFPRVFYLKYDIYRNAWPLLALATSRRTAMREPTDAAAVGATRSVGAGVLSSGHSCQAFGAAPAVGS